MHQALYRKWRPKTFSEVCGQEHITSIFKYETEHQKFSHAYLFCGSRGTGKTTCAKILAKAVNCESPVDGSPCNVCPACRAIEEGTATDVLEMDAASNNGVENIRDIRNEVVYSPSVLKYRVYIVDEVHMLSGSAFNALLKTLEEPPAHVVFILATTELHKLPATIISRCQRFEFRRISTSVLTGRLAYIADREQIEYEPEALRILAKLAQGGMRDAISLLELCAGSKQKITPSSVDETVGSGSRESLEKTVCAIAASDFDAIFSAVDEVVRSSRDLTVFWQDLLNFYRDMLVMKTTASADRYLDLTEHEAAQLKRISDLFTKETLLYHCRVLDEALIAMQKAGSAKRMVAEMSLIKLCDTSADASPEALLSRISKLETALAAGVTFRPTDVVTDGKASVSSETAEKEAEETKKVPVPSEPNPPAPALKLLRGWNEVAEQAAGGDFATLGYLKTAKALQSADGKIFIKFPNELAISLVGGDKTKEQLRAALCLALNRHISDSDLVLGVMESGDTFTDLDELEL